MPQAFLSAFRTDPSPFAVILGTNEIASAVAVHLRRIGWSVVLSHDPLLPVIRRAMAFHDALFDDRPAVEEIKGERVETAREIADAIDMPNRVAVTWLGLADLLALGSPLVLVDARMQKHHVIPDLRNLAGITVGLGPNFVIGKNCDIAVETQPAQCGLVIKAGHTRAPDGRARLLGGIGAERFAYSDQIGRWHTPVEIGTRVFKGVVLGHLDRFPVRAPIDGVVRGIARDGLDMPAHVKLLEIDPRGRHASWTGIDGYGHRIAEATVKAIKVKVAQLAAAVLRGAPLLH
jgi:xanthine dehydrogenase accessory factor